MQRALRKKSKEGEFKGFTARAHNFFSPRIGVIESIGTYIDSI
jgi:hypothetical protein